MRFSGSPTKRNVPARSPSDKVEVLRVTVPSVAVTMMPLAGALFAEARLSYDVEVTRPDNTPISGLIRMTTPWRTPPESNSMMVEASPKPEARTSRT